MRISLLLIAVFLAGSAHAVSIERKLPDAAQERVAEGAIAQLKCVVCESQSLADSDADFAREMRREIRRMAGDGQNEQQILDYFRAHYGARILLDPPVERSTALLWVAPVLMLLAGALLLWRQTRRVA